MDMELRGKLKRRGIKRIINSFRYSFDGLKYAYRFEQSMVIHILVTFIVISLGYILKIEKFEWILCFLFIGLIMATELINTAIEAVVDLISPSNHPLAKIAKDTASAAVLIFSMAAAISGLIIFVPKILALL